MGRVSLLLFLVHHLIELLQSLSSLEREESPLSSDRHVVTSLYLVEDSFRFQKPMLNIALDLAVLPCEHVVKPHEVLHSGLGRQLSVWCLLFGSWRSSLYLWAMGRMAADSGSLWLRIRVRDDERSDLSREGWAVEQEGKNVWVLRLRIEVHSNLKFKIRIYATIKQVGFKWWEIWIWKWGWGTWLLSSFWHFIFEFLW